MTRRWKGLLVVAAVLLIGSSACGGPSVVPTEAPTTAPTVEASPTAEPEPTATAEPTEQESTEEPTATATPEPSPSATDEPITPTAEPTPDEPVTEEPAQGQVLLEERCTACHGLGRVESAQKTQEEWASTVDRMIDYGAQLSDAERMVVIDYLAETYGP